MTRQMSEYADARAEVNSRRDYDYPLTGDDGTYLMCLFLELADC